MSIDGAVNGAGNPDKLAHAFFNAINLKEKRKGACAYPLARHVDFEFISEKKGLIVIRLAVNHHHDHLLVVIHLVEGNVLIFEIILEGVIHKTELLGEKEDSGRVGVMHPDLILGCKYHIHLIIMNVPIETTKFLTPEGDLVNCPIVIPQAALLKGYEAMWTARMVDERMITLQRQGSITFAMSSLGEEAAAAGATAALSIEDWIYPQYREVAAIFYRGLSIQDYIHHMFGNASDLIMGRQMPNHFGSRKLNVVTVSSPIGTKIPHAAGCAYAMKLAGEETVSLCFFGEGATSEGDFHAGLNFAAVRKAPALFFCRNNGYAISTPVKEQFASDGVAVKGIAYGIESMRVDGNDFFAVYYATKTAKDHALAGKGPFLIEAMTYRMGAHSTSDDPSAYRKAEECKEWEACDPILRLRRYLEKQNLWDENKETELKGRIKKEIDSAIEKAKNEAGAPLDKIVDYVYEEVPPALKAQLERLEKETEWHS